MNIQQQQSKQDDPMEMIKKYFALLWSKKFWIILLIFGISIVWILLYSTFLKKEQKHTATVIIKFDDPRETAHIGAITDFAIQKTEGKIALLYTNSLLSKIVDSLHLNIRISTKGIPRYSFFKKINIKENSKYGNYIISFDDDEKKLNLFYTRKELNIDNKLLYSARLPDSSFVVVDIDEFRLELYTEALIQHREIKFYLTSKRIIAEELKGKIEREIKGSQTILKISYKDKDPEFATEIINTVANVFIQQLLDYKKYRTTSILKTLEEQLTVSKNELGISERKLMRFRERNPFVTRSRESSGIFRQLTDEQTGLDVIEQNLEHLNYLIQKKDISSGDRHDLAYQEIISSISIDNIAGSQVLVEQYDILINEKNHLLNEENYTTEHYLVQEVVLKLKEMQNEIDSRTTQYITQLRKQRITLQNAMSANQVKISRLPRNELKLTELDRDRQVKSEIYSSILVKYNEAKVSDASIISDAFIIEEALVPIVIYDLRYKIKKYGPYTVGPIFGFLFSIILFLVLDAFNNYVRDSKEVESKLNLKVLATIPVIQDEKKIPDNMTNHMELDPKLITTSYVPSMANEKFRILRTKLFMEQDKHKSYIFTSYSPDDGKSLICSNIAITFAQQKISTILIDCDLRRGVLHKSFKCNKKPGITDILIKNVPITQNDISRVIQNTHVPNLFLLSNGIQVPNPSELLGSIRMQQLIDQLQKKFSVLIIDSPPIEFIPDAIVLNSLVHNMLLVVRHGKTNLKKVTEKLDEYSNIKNDFKGVIINASTEVEKEKYSSYSYYHY